VLDGVAAVSGQALLRRFGIGSKVVLDNQRWCPRVDCHAEAIVDTGGINERGHQMSIKGLRKSAKQDRFELKVAQIDLQ
jgi:hypothetical protein